MSWVPDTPLISNYLSKQPQRRKPYPPYDIDLASNKYAYIYIALLTETMCSLSLDGYWIDHTHMLTSKFNIHSLALVLHLWSKYLWSVWHATKTKQKKSLKD